MYRKDVVQFILQKNPYPDWIRVLHSIDRDLKPPRVELRKHRIYCLFS